MTPFYVAPDNVATTTTGYTAGAGQIALAAGGGAAFGTPSAGAPVAFSTFALDGTPRGIYKATGRVGDTLTGLVLLGGVDATLPPGAAVAVRWTAEHVAQLTGAVATLESVAFNARSFGVVGDGVADDSAALQAAFDAASGSGALVLPPGTYRITSNLYLFGRLDLIAHGDATILLDADLTLADGVEYWINAGIPSKGGTPATWTGRIEGVNFALSADANVQRMLNVHVGLDWRLDRCTFDLTAVGARGTIGALGCYNNSAWCAAPSRQHGRITACRFLASQRFNPGSEAIGIGNASFLWVEDNYINGFGDDGIGLHTCTDFVVARNRVYVPDGRIYCSGPRRGRVQDNYVQRIANPDNTWAGGGALMHFEIESVGQPAPTDLIVTGNRLVHGAGIPSTTYGLRLRGVRNALVADNSIHDDSGHGIGITIEGQIAPAGWTDPDGLDNDGNARVRALRVVDNMFTGLTPPPLSQNQPFGGSTVGPIQVAGNTPTATSSTFTVGEDYAFAGNVKLRDGTWSGNHLVLGTTHLWLDAAGGLRTKAAAAPASATDGALVLAQGTNGIAVFAGQGGDARLQIQTSAAGSGEVAWYSSPAAGQGARELWWQYTNWQDPHLYLRDIVNARMQVTFAPGATAAAALTQFGSVVVADGGFSGDGSALTNLNGAAIATGTVAAARLGLMTGDTGTGGTAGAVPAPAAGDAAAGKVLRADGAWAPTARVLFAQTADATLANSTTVSSLLGAGSGSATLPAGLLATGKMIRLRARGTFNSAAAPGTINLQVFLGSTRVALTSAITLAASQAGRYWDAEFDLTCRSAGVTGSVYGSGKSIFSTTVAIASGPAATPLDTTGALPLDLRAGFSIADPSNAITCSLLEIIADN